MYASLRELPNVDPSYTKPQGGKTISSQNENASALLWFIHESELQPRQPVEAIIMTPVPPHTREIRTYRNARILQLSLFSLVPWVHDIYKLTLESSCPGSK